MKKLLLASAIAALSVSAANAAPTVYGKAFLTLDYQDDSTDTDVTVYDATTGKQTNSSSTNDPDGNVKLKSNGSRIGFKGSEPLNPTTDVVYKLEYGVNVDNNIKDDTFKARDAYLGLSNKQYGSLLAGRMKTIDSEVDFANVTQGGVIGGDNVLASYDASRANNNIVYTSPDYNGFKFMADYVMDENSSKEDSFGRDAFGIGAKYSAGPMNVGASYVTAGDTLKAMRVSGNYALDSKTTLGALYQLTDRNTDDNENAFTISGQMATSTPWTAYAQGDIVNNYLGKADQDRYRVVLGGKYAFNKATTGHLYGAYMNDKTKTDTTTAKIRTVKESDKDSFGIGGGLEYKF
ncbi:porin [Psychrobacter sp.]|uniref:porin n=1 Tax=Psychrobacter sp. TaxID=56811 RepID=UPI0025FF1068|nr:porin [Psychrobacter sp.]